MGTGFYGEIFFWLTKSIIPPSYLRIVLFAARLLPEVMQNKMMHNELIKVGEFSCRVFKKDLNFFENPLLKIMS